MELELCSPQLCCLISSLLVLLVLLVLHCLLGLGWVQTMLSTARFYSWGRWLVNLAAAKIWPSWSLGGRSHMVFTTPGFLILSSRADGLGYVSFTSLSPEADIKQWLFPEASACSHCQSACPTRSITHSLAQ